MKRIILVASHLGAGSSSLCYSLAQSRIIQWVQDGIIYDNPTATESLLVSNHKYSNLVGLYVNEVIYNYQICHKKIYNACEIIYLIRDPRTAIKVARPKDAVFALDYYIFRLRRIYEMTRETKGAIFLTWENLLNNKGIQLISEKLNLPDKIEFKEMKSDKQLLDLPKPLLRKAEDAYELCLYRIRNKAQVVEC